MSTETFDFDKRGGTRYDATLYTTESPDGSPWRAAIRRDFYAHQSWGKVQRFDGSRWHDVRALLDVGTLPPPAAPDAACRAAVLDLARDGIVGTWETLGLEHRPRVGMPRARVEASRVTPGVDGALFLLELVVRADDLEHAGVLCQDAVDFLLAGDHDIEKWETHPWEPR